MASAPGVLRGIYSAAEEQLPTFRDGVPLFDTIDEYLAWARQHVGQGSNPQDPRLQHIFTTLVNWAQVQTFLLARLRQLRPKPLLAGGDAAYLGAGASGPNRAATSFEFKPVVAALERRLALPMHRSVNAASTVNTLEYLFRHMRCGIFVCVRDGQLAMFVPFVNKDYTNTWGHLLETDPPDADEYFRLKRRFYRKENIIPDKRRWWANGNIICNEHHEPREAFSNWWGDNLLAPFKHMLETLCKERNVPDVELFFNKRDHPQLKANGTEPYDFVFPQPDTPLQEDSFASHAPVMSFYCSERFADLPVPTTEDWASAVGKVLPGSFIPDRRAKRGGQGGRGGAGAGAGKGKGAGAGVGGNGGDSIARPDEKFLKHNFDKFAKEWEQKNDTAFFRGNATGAGTSAATNQRIHLAELCASWNKAGTNRGDPAATTATTATATATTATATTATATTDTATAAAAAAAAVPLLDAGITGFNVRDKKLFGEPMRFTKAAELGVGKADYVQMYEQGVFKYILYVDGHCAANRYAFLMRLGSVILKVESRCEASEMWFFPMLRPYEGGLDDNVDVQKGVLGADHVPVKADLSDLRERIQWCRENDDKCRQIAENARSKHQRCLTREPLLDYMQLLLLRVAQRFERAPDWWALPEPAAERPCLQPPRNKCARDPGKSGAYTLCRRCELEQASSAAASLGGNGGNGGNGHGAFSSSFGASASRKRNRQ